MVRAWIADVKPLLEETCYREYYEGVPQFRKDKADALRNMKTKAQSIGAWSLWEKIRAEYCLPESSLFNISHSDTYVMCAVHFDLKNSEETQKTQQECAHQKEYVHQLGCDLEHISDLRLNIAQRFFCEEEYETILSGENEREQTERFYRYWVLKESFMKATREGMALPLDSFCIKLGNKPGDPPVLIRQPEKYPLSYYYREYFVEGIPCRMAVCSTDREIDSEIHMELSL